MEQKIICDVDDRIFNEPVDFGTISAKIKRHSCVFDDDWDKSLFDNFADRMPLYINFNNRNVINGLNLVEELLGGKFLLFKQELLEKSHFDLMVELNKIYIMMKNKWNMVNLHVGSRKMSLLSKQMQTKRKIGFSNLINQIIIEMDCIKSWLKGLEKIVTEELIKDVNDATLNKRYNRTINIGIKIWFCEMALREEDDYMLPYKRNYFLEGENIDKRNLFFLIKYYSVNKCLSKTFFGDDNTEKMVADIEKVRDILENTRIKDLLLKNFGTESEKRQKISGIDLPSNQKLENLLIQTERRDDIHAKIKKIIDSFNLLIQQFVQRNENIGNEELIQKLRNGVETMSDYKLWKNIEPIIDNIDDLKTLLKKL